jgi:photosystem II protein
MNYNQYAEESQGPSKWAIASVACATTCVVATATFALSAPQTSTLYAPAAVRTTSRVAPMAQPRMVQTQAQAYEAATDEEFIRSTLDIPAQTGNKALLVTSFSSMMLAVLSAFAAAYGYRSQTIAMASAAGSRAAPKGTGSKGGQAGVGYKGSTVAGSAPTTRSGKPGYVYKLGLKNGKGNVDEYSPIYNTVEWKSDGDVYEPGFTGIALWAAGFLALLGTSAFLIFATSQI